MRKKEKGIERKARDTHQSFWTIEAAISQGSLTTWRKLEVKEPVKKKTKKEAEWCSRQCLSWKLDKKISITVNCISLHRDLSQ